MRRRRRLESGEPGHVDPSDGGARYGDRGSGNEYAHYQSHRCCDVVHGTRHNAGTGHGLVGWDQRLRSDLAAELYADVWHPPTDGIRRRSWAKSRFYGYRTNRTLQHKSNDTRRKHAVVALCCV
jgi:hypothetical protein